jgi:hypothetical protein
VMTVVSQYLQVCQSNTVVEELRNARTKTSPPSNSWVGCQYGGARNQSSQNEANSYRLRRGVMIR